MNGSTALEYFSSTYSQAREKFLGAARASNAEIACYENPHLGSEREQLFTDVALLGLESAPSVLVLCSGTHGVEGFCGSAIQTGLLRGGIAERMPPDVDLFQGCSTLST